MNALYLLILNVCLSLVWIKWFVLTVHSNFKLWRWYFPLTLLCMVRRKKPFKLRQNKVTFKVHFVPLYPTANKSTLFMWWFGPRQAICSYLNLCWASSLPHINATKPQWVNHAIQCALDISRLFFFVWLAKDNPSLVRKDEIWGVVLECKSNWSLIIVILVLCTLSCQI